MFTVTFPVSAAGAARPDSRPLHRVVSAALRACRFIEREMAARRAAEDLRSLDDRMLLDIGITRLDVERAVRCGLPERE